MENNVIKVGNEDNSKTFRITAVWWDNSFEFTLFHEANAWHANVSQKILEDLASTRDKDLGAYYKSVKKWFLTQMQDVFFDINPDVPELIITQKTKRMTVNLFSVNIKKENFEICIYKLVDNLNDKNVNLNSKLHSCEQEISNTINDKHSCEEKLKEFCNTKSNWENEMYSKVMLALNEKKKRIRYLTELMESKYALGVIESAERKIKISTRGHEGRKLSTSDFSEEENEGYETNDDEPKVQHEDVPTPETKRTLSLLLDSDQVPTTSFLPKRVKKPDDAITQCFIKNTETIDVESAAPPPEPKLEEKHVTPFTFSSQDLFERM